MLSIVAPTVDGEFFAAFPIRDFDGFRVKEASNWRGLAIEGWQVEVDTASAYDSSIHYLALGVVVRNGAQLQLIASNKDGGFRNRVRLVLADNLDIGSEGIEIAFAKWRLTLVQGEESIEIFSHTADLQRRSL